MTPDERPYERLSGRKLIEFRQNAGLTQTQLAQAAGIGRHAVSYWELKAIVDETQYAPERMLAVLGIRVVRAAFRDAIARAGAPARHGVLVSEVERRALERLEARQDARRAQHAIQVAARLSASPATAPDVESSASPAAPRAPCGALTRRGLPCRAQSEPGRRRCQLHGGRSTGPRTPEGRARIAEAQRQRWAAWRASQEQLVLSIEEEA